MSAWSQLLFQESLNPVIELLSLFHDYSLSIITIILFFVAGMTTSMVTNNLISNRVIVTAIELIWTVIPIVILVFIAIPSLKILYFIEENSPFLTLKIIGHQWYWRYEIVDLDLEFDSYMTTDTENGEFRLLDVDHRIVVPTAKNIRGLITAADVLHCWAIPTIGIKADAVPGRLNQVNFLSLRPRVSYGQCSEICGANHRFIPIALETIRTKNFLEWANLYCVG